MNWAKYADKKGKTADFKSKEREVQPAQEEVKDSKGKGMLKVVKHYQIKKENIVYHN